MRKEKSDLELQAVPFTDQELLDWAKQNYIQPDVQERIAEIDSILNEVKYSEEVK